MIVMTMIDKGGMIMKEFALRHNIGWMYRLGQWVEDIRIKRKIAKHKA